MVFTLVNTAIATWHHFIGMLLQLLPRTPNRTDSEKTERSPKNSHLIDKV